MGMKKGVYFTIDAIIGASIVIVVIALVSSLYVREQPSFHVEYLSQDIVRSLSSITVKNVDNEYIRNRIGDGTIKNTDNNVLEQIGEFWVNSQFEFANKTAANVTEPWISNNTGLGVWVDNNLVYQRDLPIEKSLVSSKVPISGVRKNANLQYSRQNPPELWGPIIIEVRVWQ